ncbi:MAG: sugar phosphate isomerase/epimerase family protein [Gemmatimonadales bacterium]
MTSRRQFVRALVAATGITDGVRLARHGVHRLKRVGLELYSVRDAMRADPDGTLAAVRRMGYDDVELLWSFGNFGRTPDQVLATLQRLGLRAPSAHIAPELLLSNWQVSLDTARHLGHSYLVVPSLPDETRNSLDAWRRWADRFNQAGAAARRSGIWLAFHNEPEHQRPIDNVVPYDLFIDHTDPEAVRLQLDVGNMLLGGGDPFAYLARHRARYWSFHLKDVVADRSHDTELGAGSFDFGRFLAAVQDLERKPCYVEQEAAPQPLISVQRDLRYLRDLRF